MTNDEKMLLNAFHAGWLTGNPDDPSDCEMKAITAAVTFATKAKDAEISGLVTSVEQWQDCSRNKDAEIARLKASLSVSAACLDDERTKLLKLKADLAAANKERDAAIARATAAETAMQRLKDTLPELFG